MTEITFTSDSTFEYIFSGDVLHKNLRGIYFIRHNDVYLRFDEGEGPTIKLDIDSVEAKAYGLPADTKIYEFANANYHDRELKEEAGRQFHEKYKFEKQKLYVYNISTGELIRTFKYYDSKNKKWILRESYLEKTK